MCQKDGGANVVRKAHDVKSQGHAESWWEEDCASFKGPAGEVLTALLEVATIIKCVLLQSREQQEQLGGAVTYFSTQSR